MGFFGCKALSSKVVYTADFTNLLMFTLVKLLPGPFAILHEESFKYCHPSSAEAEAEELSRASEELVGKYGQKLLLPLKWWNLGLFAQYESLSPLFLLTLSVYKVYEVLLSKKAIKC